MRNPDAPRYGIRIELDKQTRDDLDYLREHDVNITKLLKAYIQEKTVELKKEKEIVA